MKKITDEDLIKHHPDKNDREFILGYFDGREKDSPEPSDNRSHCYRHGFLNGRDDLSGKPRNTAQNLREAAEKAILWDTPVDVQPIE